MSGPVMPPRSRRSSTDRRRLMRGLEDRPVPSGDRRGRRGARRAVAPVSSRVLRGADRERGGRWGRSRLVCTGGPSGNCSGGARREDLRLGATSRRSTWPPTCVGFRTHPGSVDPIGERASALGRSRLRVLAGDWLVDAPGGARSLPGNPARRGLHQVSSSVSGPNTRVGGSTAVVTGKGATTPVGAGLGGLHSLRWPTTAGDGTRAPEPGRVVIGQGASRPSVALWDRAPRHHDPNGPAPSGTGLTATRPLARGVDPANWNRPWRR